MIQYNNFDLPSVINKPQQPIIHMPRGLRNNTKMEQISIRLPVDIIEGLNNLKEKEQTDRSSIIVKALRYWISVDGKISTDNEYVEKIKNMDSVISELQKSMQEIVSNYEREASVNRELLAEQQKTINTLVRLMHKEE